MTAVDRFWGIPPSAGVVPAAGEVLAEWTPVEVDGDATGLSAVYTALLPELRLATGQTVVAGRANGREVPLATRRADGVVELAFDPDAAVAALLERAAWTPKAPVSARLPFPYHRVPGPIRRIVRDLLVKRSRGSDAYPAWPVEASIEVVRRIALAARRIAEPELVPTAFWPDGKRFALCLTQDIDTAAGLAVAAEIARDQAERGLGCCWFIVGAGYDVDDATAASLREHGEIGLHDMHHDNRIAFMDDGARAERLDSAAGLIERFGIRGFRSPSMLRTPALMDALAERFAWDSSIPDSGLYPAPNGCGTVFPFMRRGLLVLPATVPPDGQLIARGLDPDGVVQAWIGKLDWIAAAGGVAVHLAHPERGFSADEPMREAYRRFLDHVRQRDDAWVALPSQIADHWRAREASIG
jgi:peptidoglycan/xylan/chitin deacetylase (PgdA/CDA1 family)